MKVTVQGFTFNNVSSITVESGFVTLWDSGDACMCTYALSEFYPDGSNAELLVEEQE